MQSCQVVQWKTQKVDGLGLKSEQSKVVVIPDKVLTFWEAHKTFAIFLMIWTFTLSKRPKHEEDFFKFCVFLRKFELYILTGILFALWPPFALIWLTIFLSWTNSKIIVDFFGREEYIVNSKSRFVITTTEPRVLLIIVTSKTTRTQEDEG